MQQLNEQPSVTESIPPGRPLVPANIQPGRHRRGLRTAAIVMLIVLLATVFSTGLFAGWVFGTQRSGGTQPASTPPVATPSITTSGTSLDAIREAVGEGPPDGRPGAGCDEQRPGTGFRSHPRQPGLHYHQ